MTVEKAKSRWKGPVVPVLTIFNEDLSLDLEGLRGNIRYLLDAGAQVGNTVFLVCGGAGDFPVLTTDERKKVAETVADEVQGRVPIIVGAGHTSTLISVELGKHALEIGADAIQVNPPYYHPPSRQDILYHFEVISDSVDIGIVAYNTYWTTVNIGLEGLAQLASLQNLIGVKWASPSPTEYKMAYEQFADRLAFIDNEGDTVFAHKQGGVAWISHISSFWPQHEWQILELMDAGRYPEAQEKITGFNVAFQAFRDEMEAQASGDGHVIKKVMELVGLTGGPSRPPTPYIPMTDQQRATLSDLFRERIGDPTH